MTPISYAETEKILDVKNITLKQAVARGVFTKLPRTGLSQPLIREQVELFIGKKRLSLDSLSQNERAKWDEYAAQAIAPHQMSEPDSLTPERAELVAKTLGLAKLYERGALSNNAYADAVIAASGSIIMPYRAQEHSKQNAT